MHHIPADITYHGLWNCHHVLAVWLRELDCRIEGLVMFATFRVINSQTDESNTKKIGAYR